MSLSLEVSFRFLSFVVAKDKLVLHPAEDKFSQADMYERYRNEIRKIDNQDILSETRVNREDVIAPCHSSLSFCLDRMCHETLND